MALPVILRTTIMSQSNSLKISVIVPTCHRNDLLALCLDCLAPGAQSLPAEQYEVIVTDDGLRSTAEAMLADRYPWVRWVAGPRRGPAANRNNGAALAQGEWLAFTDDDCLPAPGWLSELRAAMRQEVFVCEGKTTCLAGVHSPLEHAPVNLTGGWLWSCNMMVRKSLFKQMSGFDESFPHPHMEDVDFRERLKNDGMKCVFVCDAIVDHPPRRVAWGAKRGAAQESEVMWHYKIGKPSSATIKLLRSTAGFRIRSILRCPFSTDTVTAFASLICELTFICVRVTAWNKKYKTSFSTHEVR